MFPWRNAGTDNHELRVSSDILPGSVPCTFSHSLVQPPVHICPQSHGHLYVVLSGPEQWTLPFFLPQRCKEDEITETVFNKGLVVWRVMMTVKYGTDIFWEVFFSLAGDRFFFIWRLSASWFLPKQCINSERCFALLLSYFYQN